MAEARYTARVLVKITPDMRKELEAAAPHHAGETISDVVRSVLQAWMDERRTAVNA